MDNCLQVTQLPVGPLVERTVYDGIVVAGINKQHLVLDVVFLSFVERPQRTRQGQRVEEVVGDTDKDIHAASVDNLLTDVTVSSCTVCCRTCHDKARATGLIEITIEVGNP